MGKRIHPIISAAFVASLSTTLLPRTASADEQELALLFAQSVHGGTDAMLHKKPAVAEKNFSDAAEILTAILDEDNGDGSLVVAAFTDAGIKTRQLTIMAASAAAAALNERADGYKFKCNVRIGLDDRPYDNMVRLICDIPTLRIS